MCTLVHVRVLESGVTLREWDLISRFAAGCKADNEMLFYAMVRCFWWWRNVELVLHGWCSEEGRSPHEIHLLCAGFEQNSKVLDLKVT